MVQVRGVLAGLSLLSSGAIFGFFYAWVCSTMWGLDAADPRVAMAAMQAMNASVRNAVFAPAFFGTPFILFLTAAAQPRSAAYWFAGGGLVYLLFGIVLTMSVNVPMNEALAVIAVPEDVDAARQIWLDYSPRWQLFNTIRTVASGATLACVGVGIREMGRRS